ncbi:MAG: alkaline phosphatase family protein [Mucilaginibacter sp.]|nr:alkaline phosphatase family protein [Mucilaginibacter sp.]
MKRLFLLLTSFFCLLNCFGQSVKHVILISIDGFHPDMYLDNSWPSPNLRQLMKNGTYANHMVSVFPSYTYPSHTAMVTGAYPARSGINYNQPIGSNGNWFWFAKDIKVPTLWQALLKAGKTTASVEWPVSVTTQITWDLPEIWSNAHPEDRITVARDYATPGLIAEIEKNATGKLDSNSMSEEYLSLDEQSGRAAAYIFQAKKPAFMAVHFACVDGMEHGYGRDADSVRLALAANDHAIGDILEAVERSGLKDSTTVIIVGDHGFCTIHQIFRPNMLIKNVSAAFIAAGGSAFLYRYGDTKKEDVASIIKSVTDSLNKLPKDKRSLFRIIDRKELDKMGADSAAIMALSAVPGTVFSGSITKAKTANNGPGTFIQQNPLDGVFVPTQGGHHGYDPNRPEMFTGFIAYGARINKGGHIKELCVTDIAPLVAKLLGIEFNTPDGHLPAGIINNGYGDPGIK